MLGILSAGRGNGALDPSGMGSTANLTVLTAPGANNTKGAWTQLEASAPFDAVAVLFHVAMNAGVNQMALIDLGVGSSGNEHAIVDNLWTDSNSGTSFQSPFETTFLMPVRIAAGQRVVARYQSTGAVTVNGAVTFLKGGPNMPRGGSRVISLGADTGTSGAALIKSIGSGLGAWREISSSCPEHVSHLFLLLGAGAPVSERAYVDIGIGAASSEYSIAERLNVGYIYSSLQYLLPVGQPGWLPVSIPQGSRVAARGQAGNSQDMVGVILGLVP